jgi:hypothetical protein
VGQSAQGDIVVLCTRLSTVLVEKGGRSLILFSYFLKKYTQYPLCILINIYNTIYAGR